MSNFILFKTSVYYLKYQNFKNTDYFTNICFKRILELSETELIPSDYQYLKELNINLKDLIDICKNNIN